MVLGNLLGKGTASAKTQRHGQIWGVQGTEKRAVGLEVGEHLLASFIWVIRQDGCCLAALPFFSGFRAQLRGSLL